MPLPLRARRTGAPLLATLAVALVSSTALAGEFRPDSRIDAVTVYPAGAEVTRAVPVSLPAGDHVVFVEGLPDGIDAGFLRVDGAADAALTIQSVDVARVPVIAEAENRNALEAEIETLRDERARLDGVMRTAEMQRRMITALAGRTVAAATTGAADEDGDKVAGMSPAELYTFIDEKHTAVEERILAARQGQRAIDKRIEEIMRQLSRQTGDPQWASRVAVRISAPADATGTLNVRYRVGAAGWRPVYDARLDTGGENPSLTIVQRAEISQTSGEDWRGVKLTLATANPLGATSAPEPRTRYIDFVRPRPEPRNSMPARNYGGAADTAAAPEADEEMAKVAEAPVPVVDTGFDAEYRVQGVADIDASGDTRLVRIADHVMPAALEARIVPALDAHAYLSAKLTFEGRSPLPAGPVALFRDGMNVGASAMPVLNAGDETVLGFGRDERITVERTQVVQRKGETGVFTRESNDIRDWRTEIANRHAQPIAIVVYETLPRAIHEEIRVSALDSNDKPDVSDAEGRPGVLAWRFTLQPQAERTISFGYRIDWPRDREIVTGMR